jgi:DNA polymerase I
MTCALTSTLRNYSTPNYLLIQDGKTLARQLKAIQNTDLFGIDCETTGLDPKRDRIRLVQIAVPHAKVLLIDLFAIAPKHLKPLRQLLNSPALKIGHNLKFEWQFLTQAGLGLAHPFFDTQLAYRVWSAGIKTKLSLKSVASKLLGVKLNKSLQHSNFAQAELTSGQLRYAAIDAAILLDLYPILHSRLKQSKLLEVARLEFSCIPVTAQMELNGMLLDLSRWQGYGASLEKQKAAALAVVKHLSIPGKQQLSLLPEITDTINPNSPKQLLAALQAIGAPIKSTSEKELVPLAGEFPVIQALLDYRKLQKVLTVFDTSLPKHVHPTTGRIHANWFQYGAKSGRYSCRNPALQTIPRHKAARQCFVAAPSCRIVKADYSQIELRIVAKLSGDARLLRAYRLGEDIHRLTASLITERPIEKIAPEDRTLAKAINFGLIYGMSALKLQVYAETKYGIRLSLEEARLFRKRFFEAYPGIKRWHDMLAGLVYGRQKVNEIRTLYGRRRRWRKKPRLTEFYNHPVQGLCADILKLALIDLETVLIECGAKLIAVVHDEILLECPENVAGAIARQLQRCMERAARSFLDPIPAVVEVKVAASWGGE